MGQSGAERTSGGKHDLVVLRRQQCDDEFFNQRRIEFQGHYKAVVLGKISKVPPKAVAPWMIHFGDKHVGDRIPAHLSDHEGLGQPALQRE